MDFIQKNSARNIVKNMNLGEPIDLHLKFPSASDEAIDLLKKLLAFNPNKRIKVDEAMNHPYLRHVHESMDAVKPTTPFVADFEKQWGPVIPKEELQKLFLSECIHYPLDNEKVSKE